MFVMRQSRLESFFETPARPPPQPRLGLLDLPPSIRQLIYKHAGLVDQTIDLNYSNLLVYPYKQYPDSCFAVRLRCAHSALPIVRRRDDSAPIGEEEYWELDEEEWELETTEPQLLSVDRCVECSDGRGLLFVSKRISREVVPFVYANNIFTVRQEAPHGLKRVKMIGVDGMAALTSLTMKIGKKEGRLRFDANHVNDSPPQPLHLGQKSSRTSMEDYEAVIERLAKHVRPRKLAMFLILGAPNLHILHQVLRPLFQMPTLKHCGLWSFVRPQISRAVEYNTIPGRFTLTEDAPPLTPRTSFQIPTAPIEEATSILEFATRKLTSGANEIGAGFRYLDLPAELRLHILGNMFRTSSHYTANANQKYVQATQTWCPVKMFNGDPNHGYNLLVFVTSTFPTNVRAMEFLPITQPKKGKLVNFRFCVAKSADPPPRLRGVSARIKILVALLRAHAPRHGVHCFLLVEKSGKTLLPSTTPSIELSSHQLEARLWSNFSRTAHLGPCTVHQACATPNFLYTCLPWRAMHCNTYDGSSGCIRPLVGITYFRTRRPGLTTLIHWT